MKRKGLYGLQLDREPFRGRSPEDQVAMLCNWGVNAVFGGYDAPAFVYAAREAGIQIHAEFGCFAGEAWWRRYPDSRPVDSAGQLLTPEEGYHGVNPSHPDIRRELLENLTALLNEYSMDGVWLDFIRWPCHWEVPSPRLIHTSFDDATVQRFVHDRGVSLEFAGPRQSAQVLLSRYRDEWLAWRREQILSWVVQAREIVNRVSPETELGLFAVPWRPGEYDHAIIDIVAQDHQALAPWIDTFSPMVYHAMCARPVDWIGEVVRSFAERTGKVVWPIIQSVDHPEPLNTAEYEQALEQALDAPGSQGLLVFTLQGMLEAEKRVATRRQFLSH